jgi:hypothetical protein
MSLRTRMRISGTRKVHLSIDEREQRCTNPQPLP